MRSADFLMKIDKAFIDMLPDDISMVPAIIQLARGLNLHIVAEGVETKQQLDLLRAEGCIEAQGFLFSPAVPSEKIRELFSHPL